MAMGATGGGSSAEAPLGEAVGAGARTAASGGGRLRARRVGDRTVLVEAHASSPLRFVRPDFAGSAAAVCLVTFGGGLVDGDAIDTRIDVEAGATLVVFTQSSTKVFRGSARQSISARVAGTLVLLPDPVAAFKDASYTQRVDVELAGDGRCLLLDGFTSGRAAYGERWAMNRLDMRTTIRHGGHGGQGRRVLANDALQLVPGSGAPEHFDAFFTLLSVGCLTTDLLETPAPPTRDLAIATSALGRAVGREGAIVRIAASSPAGALAAARHRLRNLPDIDVVDPFASRH